jgi:methionine sulfoxide reductase catalytic subunit
VSDFREQLTKGKDVVDPKTWAGAIPAAFGIAPRVRIGAKRWFNLLWLLPIGWGVLLVAVAAAQYLRGLPEVQAFIFRHPGTGSSAQFASAMPGWLRAQHFLNLFFLIFIIRAGLQILADHPRLYWTRHSTPGKEWFRMQERVPDNPLWTAKQDSITLPKNVGLPGIRHSIGLARWWHLGVDVLWLVNGVTFYVLLFATGEWRRIVPTSVNVFADAASVLLQYLSLSWPTETGWVAYNGLQVRASITTRIRSSRCATS